MNSTCRFCKQHLLEKDGGLRYGPRHYAHLRCLKASRSAAKFEELLRQQPLWRVKAIPYFVAMELGILPLLRAILNHDVDFGQLDIEILADTFPATFGLRAFPGKVFKIGRQSSYISEGRVILYTQVQDGDRWLDFAKGTASELRKEIVA